MLHAVLYKETPEDIYSLFGTHIPRNKIKIAVISSIYGSSPKRVQKISGMPLEEILKIHEHFQLKQIKTQIEDSYSRNGYFHNLYGRPIYEISSPVNYWLQYSAADYACLAFLDLIKRCNLNIKASIHDAVLLEVNSKEKSYLEMVKKIKDPITNIELLVEHSHVK